MNCRTFCTSLLRGARDDLNRFFPHLKSQFKGMYVDRSIWGSAKYFWVKKSNGKSIWEGSACCVYHARYLAITKITDQARCH